MILATKEIRTKTIQRVHFTQVRMAMTKEMSNTVENGEGGIGGREGTGGDGDGGTYTVHSGWERKLALPPWKSIGGVSLN